MSIWSNFIKYVILLWSFNINLTVLSSLSFLSWFKKITLSCSVEIECSVWFGWLRFEGFSVGLVQFKIQNSSMVWFETVWIWESQPNHFQLLVTHIENKSWDWAEKENMWSMLPQQNWITDPVLMLYILKTLRMVFKNSYKVVFSFKKS